jgi:1-acyl-sn-glycerol-3-phosphate acyltransferase
MADRSEPDPGATVEFSLAEPGAPLPATVADELRDHLPGLEPDRQLTDWGRSERIEGAIDRSLYAFLYHYWFRVEVEGIENVPSDGGALLIANRAGALPPDGAMIAKAMREEHPSGRSLHLATDRDFKSVPGLGMLATKVGAVTAHPANLMRLLFDEGELVLSFPEGREGPRKPLKDRYRLRGFDAQFTGIARRASVPIIPVAVLGAEEATPTLIRRLPLIAPVPLPAKFRIRFLDPPPADPAEEAALTHELRGLIQENLFEMVAARRSVWLG